MPYAKVVVDLPVEGPFDYLIPQALSGKINPGARVWVNFGNKRMVGYVVSLTRQTRIQKVKPILELIDESPILDKNDLSLTRELSEYYCCSWAEAIATSLPDFLRKGRKVPIDKSKSYGSEKGVSGSGASNTLFQVSDDGKKWELYIEEAKKTLADGRSVILLLPDINAVMKAKEIMDKGLDVPSALLHRRQAHAQEEWLKIREGKVNLVIGTRSAIFAPCRDLGLVIIDDEEDPVYKQDQVPHYHAREVAFWRTRMENAKLLLSGRSPSLESFYLSQSQGIKRLIISRKTNFPQVNIVDMQRLPYAERKSRSIFTKYLQDAIFSVLNAKGKMLLFLNRKGFATVASCLNCRTVLKCPRCNINLTFHYDSQSLKCHYCNFRMEPPKICPQCNSGYIKFSGTGTEKVESELARIFPQARIKVLESAQGNPDFNEADIFVATSLILKRTSFNFDLVGVLEIDNSLNRIDFRAGEKTFDLLTGLWGLTEKRIIIQTRLPGHHSLRAMMEKNADLFYTQELKERKQLKFPPYKHLFLIKLRSKKEAPAKDAAVRLFDRLSSANKDKGIKILSVNPSLVSKLRSYFYWQVLIRTGKVKKACVFIKKHLKNFAHSGIIVTVDVDPL